MRTEGHHKAVPERLPLKEAGHTLPGLLRRWVADDVLYTVRLGG